jgi:hypothetical protein
MTAQQPSLRDRVLAYVAECEERAAPADEVTPDAIRIALGGSDSPEQIGRVLQTLTESGLLRAENITPFCDLPTLSFSTTER